MPQMLKKATVNSFKRKRSDSNVEKEIKEKWIESVNYVKVCCRTEPDAEEAKNALHKHCIIQCIKTSRYSNMLSTWYRDRINVGTQHLSIIDLYFQGSSESGRSERQRKLASFVLPMSFSQKNQIINWCMQNIYRVSKKRSKCICSSWISLNEIFIIF